jgi:hypothetical protein
MDGVVSTDLRPKDLIFDHEVAYYSCIRQHSTFALHSYSHVKTYSLGVIQLLHESEYANSGLLIPRHSCADLGPTR